MMGEIITAAEARELLSYDPDTGILTWLIARGRAPAGQRAGTVCASYTRPRPYRWRAVGVNGRRYKESRMAWLLHYGEWPAGLIDHINGNPLDNRLRNLRVAGHGENLQNTRLSRRNVAGFKGVTRTPAKTERWQARLYAGGKAYSLGTFATPEEAHEAYCRAATEHFGEFARFS